MAMTVEASLLHFHNERYELRAWCIMPNHVHVLVDVRNTPLWKIIAMWKKFSGATALRVLRLERRSPDRRVSDSVGGPIRRSALRPFWQREYWDTFMRSEEQERKAVRYIESNPVTAKLCRTADDWPFSSARFRDNYARLNLSSQQDHVRTQKLYARQPVRVPLARCAAAGG